MSDGGSQPARTLTNMSRMTGSRRPKDNRPPGHPTVQRGRNMTRMPGASAPRMSYGATMSRPEDERAQAFADMLRDARKRRGYTQEEVAALADGKTRTLIRWEKGETANPDAGQLRQVAIVLGLDESEVHRVLGWRSDDEPEREMTRAERFRHAQDLIRRGAAMMNEGAAILEQLGREDAAEENRSAENNETA